MGRLKELAYLNKNLSIKLINEPEKAETEYCFPGGLSDSVEYLDGNEDLIHHEVMYSKQRRYRSARRLSS